MSSSTERPSGIQDEFFNRARREALPVTIFLTNGKKLSGRIRSFDKFTVVVEINRLEQMIFKHAISTVSVGRPAAAGAPVRRDDSTGDGHPSPAPAVVPPEVADAEAGDPADPAGGQG